MISIATLPIFHKLRIFLNSMMQATVETIATKLVRIQSPEIVISSIFKIRAIRNSYAGKPIPLDTKYFPVLNMAKHVSAYIQASTSLPKPIFRNGILDRRKAAQKRKIPQFFMLISFHITVSCLMML